MASAGPLPHRIVLGAALRRLREARGISRELAGEEIRASASKIRRLELGRVGPRSRDLNDLLTLYRVDDDQRRRQLLELAESANAPDWWDPFTDLVPNWFKIYLGLERSATLVRTYELQFLPGLLQTPDYARATTGLRHSDVHEVDRRVELRMRRQQILHHSNGPIIRAIVDETALRRPIAGREAMRAQLRWLIDVVDQPSVRLQIVPFQSGGHAAAGGAFTILRFAEPELRDLVYLEQLFSSLYLNKDDEIELYADVFARLSARSARPLSDTPTLLQAILADL